MKLYAGTPLRIGKNKNAKNKETVYKEYKKVGIRSLSILLSMLLVCSVATARPAMDNNNDKDLIPIVNRQGKWGIVHKNGEEITPCIYNEVLTFDN